MNERELAQNLHTVQNVMFDLVDVKSDLYQLLHQEENRMLLTKVENFSNELRKGLRKKPAAYFDALLQLKENNLEPLVDYLYKYPAIKVIINKHYSVLEELYQIRINLEKAPISNNPQPMSHEARMASQTKPMPQEVKKSIDTILPKELLEAAEKGRSDVCLAWIKKGGDPNLKNEYGVTLLQTAATYDHTDLCLKLLENGADPNSQNKYGDTPLHDAAEQGFVNTCRILLKNGADPALKNKNGKMPFNTMLRRKYQKLF